MPNNLCYKNSLLSGSRMIICLLEGEFFSIFTNTIKDMFKLSILHNCLNALENFVLPVMMNMNQLNIKHPYKQ